jgi:transcriptional regulator
MSDQSIDRDLKKGSAELLVLSLLEARRRHGYEISKLIETRSKGAVRFRVASLYPLLYRLEERGYIQGCWVEKDGERRKRYYRLTPAGRNILRDRRSRWAAFVEAIHRITATENA